jgi:ADP-ribose pyrophosphatase
MGENNRPDKGPRELDYENARFRVFRQRLTFPAFAKDLYIVSYGPRAAVVVEGPQGLLLTRQYRLMIDRVSWEIPWGRVEPGESLEQAAARECLEETGYECGGLSPLIDFQPGLDTVENPTRIFTAATFREVHAIPPDRTDAIERAWVPLGRCVEMAYAGEIADSLSIIAVLAYAGRSARAGA